MNTRGSSRSACFIVTGRPGLRPRAGPGVLGGRLRDRIGAARREGEPRGPVAAALPDHPPAHPGPGHLLDGHPGPGPPGRAPRRTRPPGRRGLYPRTSTLHEVGRNHGRREKKDDSPSAASPRPSGWPSRRAWPRRPRTSASSTCGSSPRSPTSSSSCTGIRPGRTPPSPRPSRRRSRRPGPGRSASRAGRRRTGSFSTTVRSSSTSFAKARGALRPRKALGRRPASRLLKPLGVAAVPWRSSRGGPEQGG